MATQTDVLAKQKVDIIWNMTLVCPWNCAICCVDAVEVKKNKGLIQLRSDALTKVEQITPDPSKGSLFDQALALRQHRGLELDFAGKMRVLDHLQSFLPKIDVSGGDPLSVTENLQVMKIAAQRFGKEQITLTATGAGLARCNPAEIAPFIGELNFTYDNITVDGNPNRPAGYANGNLRKAAQFVAAGVKTRAECPLSAQNLSEEVLRRLYLNLHQAGIDQLLLMRLFPVGRGTFRATEVPTPAEYRQAIQLLRQLEADLGHPKLKLQCALKFFDRQDMKENPCDLLRESFGLMSDGTLLASPWAIGGHGKPLDEVWVLGNLANTPLADLLASPKAQEFAQRLNENFGHCKIFSFLNSQLANPIDRIFDIADPLYTGTPDILAEVSQSGRTIFA